MRGGTAVVLIAVLLVASAACGGSAPSQSAGPLKGVEGYWSVAGDRLATEDFLLRIEWRDGAYRVSVDGGPLRPAETADGRLVLPVAGPGGRDLEFSLDGGRAAVFAYVSRGADAEPGEPACFWQAFPAEPVAQAEYEKRAAARADARMRLELLTLEIALREWTKRHGEPPAPADVAADAAFGRWMKSGMGGFEAPWPTNPYTGEPMRAGSEPGDFTYARQGDGFTLTGTLHDGSTFSSAGGPTR